MNKVSFVSASGDDKAALLGPEFRHIDVIDFQAIDGVFLVRIAWQSQVLTLVGDPQEALRVAMGGVVTGVAS
ncbi:hypothetical protein [Cupriavidus oxalaticus]|uniref:Uncharacterized protein n=1 Tax=Cupriavidus oxalaticus TaxID=96344 RepID=A0A5P3VLU4_9BURK|nr:hypothetical protein [Cupriavidus oxalaticus]QEZ47200.1 hypothetical protein D2917_23920 [Cupriavidus oxalaticus]